MGIPATRWIVATINYDAFANSVVYTMSGFPSQEVLTDPISQSMKDLAYFIADRQANMTVAECEADALTRTEFQGATQEPDPVVSKAGRFPVPAPSAPIPFVPALDPNNSR
jgi:hypothetical protein